MDLMFGGLTGNLQFVGFSMFYLLFVFDDQNGECLTENRVVFIGVKATGNGRDLFGS